MIDLTNKNNKLPHAIGLHQAGELLILPPEIVEALCYSGLIKADMNTSPFTLSLEDVLTVSTVLNRYRTHYNDTVVSQQEMRIWDILNTLKAPDKA